MQTVEEKIEDFFRTSGIVPSRILPDELYYILRNLGLSAESCRDVFLQLFERRLLRFPAANHFELFLTESCNLGCKYCFVEGKNNKNRMTFETAKRGIDFFLSESGPNKDLTVVFFGGEPLLEYPLIHDVVLYAEEVGAKSGKVFTFDATSNGLLIDDERAAFFRDHNVSILLSIDGDEKTHDTYRRTLGNKPTFAKLMERMRILSKYQRTIGAKLTVMPEFAAIVDKSVISLYESGVNHFLIGYATGMNFPLEAGTAYYHSLCRLFDWWRGLPFSRRPVVENFMESLGGPLRNDRNNYGCRAGRTGLTLNCRGDVYACSKMLGANGLTGILPLGTLDKGIIEVETRMKLCGYLPPDRPGCWSCQNQSKCMGGCYAVNWTTTGDPFRSGKECHMVTQSTRIDAYIRSRNQEDRSRVDWAPQGFAN